jgi:hypothetical protein
MLRQTVGGWKGVTDMDVKKDLMTHGQRYGGTWPKTALVVQIFRCKQLQAISA